jgi:signal transduction histidine kinase
MAKKGWLTNLKTKQRKTSMFFVLWGAFAALSFLLLLVFSLTQRFVLQDTYRQQAITTLNDKGGRIQRALRETPPEEFGGNYDAFILYLSTREGAQICILDGDGNILMPLKENIDPSLPLWQENLDFSKVIATHKEKLAEKGATPENHKSVVYDADGGFVYGAALPGYNGQTEDTYLYVYESMELVFAVERELNVRMIWIALFVFVLSFAASSALSGVLIRPLDEISAKAQQLARGDFDVNFQGEDYFEEMESLSASLNFAKDELSKADRMQKELIANVSHDFKTPLTMIKAYAEMLVEFAGEDKVKREKSAQVIIDEADRLASLVSDVLDLSKIRSGIQALSLEPFDICAYCKEILARFDYLSQTQGYQFEAEIAQGLYTVADKQKIGQVLYNLIGNAVNYTGKNKKVRVVLKKEKGAIYFAVMDTGKGIKKEELSEIWDRYYRSSESHKRPVKGTGLGLSIVKTILERHCFEYGVDSVVGVGSTFYAYFPLSGEETNEEE